MKNQVHLIAYVDRFSGGSLNALKSILNTKLKDVFAGIHILPFFNPIDGSDAGFDPIDHREVDPRIGNWDDIKAISQTSDIMADVIVNHMSAKSPQFLDFLEHGDKSDFKDLFLTFDKVFPNGTTEEELLTVYRPRPGLPFTLLTLKNGTKKLFWTTFTSNQIDIDVRNKVGKDYLLSILKQFQKVGIKMIRLDAAGYAIKIPGTSCFMVPESFEFIEWFKKEASEYGMEVLVEIHSYYKRQMEIASKVDWVYDFALPPLVLHAIYNRTSLYLKRWIEIRPNNAVNVLDTHDGIGVIDVGRSGNEPGFLPDEEIDRLVTCMHEMNNGQSQKATGASASNLDLYQVNCTYYDALGQNDQWYLLARAIQFFTPGIPQIYYMGLLAEPNDMELLNRSNVGRDINRHYFDEKELNQALNRKVVQKLIKLIEFRNTHPAFQGKFHFASTDSENLNLCWTSEKESVELSIDFNKLNFLITYSTEGETKEFEF